MTKTEILKLIDECPYWGEDIESETMIKDLKKWFKFKLKENDDDSIIVTKKEFRYEIQRIWNELRQLNLTPNQVRQDGTTLGPIYSLDTGTMTFT